MKVKDLIKELKKMPQNIEVGFRHHDNSEWEVAGWLETVDLFDKKRNKPESYICEEEKNIFKSLPSIFVILSD